MLYNILIIFLICIVLLSVIIGGLTVRLYDTNANFRNRVKKAFSKKKFKSIIGLIKEIIITIKKYRNNKDWIM